MIAHLIKFFLTNYYRTEKHYGVPNIIKDLINFQPDEFSYSQLFKTILTEMQGRREDEKFLLYLLELFSFI